MDLHIQVYLHLPLAYTEGWPITGPADNQIFSINHHIESNLPKE